MNQGTNPIVQTIDIWSLNINYYHLIGSIFQMLIEFVYFVLCVIKTNNMKNENLGIYVLYIIICFCNFLIVGFCLVYIKKDYHFLNIGNITNYEYYSYYKINCDLDFVAYGARFILVSVFFTKSSIAFIILGVYPFVISLLTKFYWMITKKYMCTHVEINPTNSNNNINHVDSDVNIFLNKNIKQNVTTNLLQNIENTECVICMNFFLENQSIRILDCNHIYHSDCIEAWLKIGTTCPTCKQHITNAVNFHCDSVI